MFLIGSIEINFYLVSSIFNSAGARQSGKTPSTIGRWRWSRNFLRLPWSARTCPRFKAAICRRTPKKASCCDRA